MGTLKQDKSWAERPPGLVLSACRALRRFALAEDETCAAAGIVEPPQSPGPQDLGFQKEAPAGGEPATPPPPPPPPPLFRHIIGSDGGMQLVAGWLGEAHGEAHIVAVCSLLEALCHDQANADMFCAARGMELITAVLGRPASSRDSLDAAIQLLIATATAADPERSCQRFVEAGGFRALVSAMTMFSMKRAPRKTASESEFHINVCRALFHLVESPAHRAKAIEHGVLEALACSGGILSQTIRRHDVQATEYVGAVLAQLADGQTAVDVAHYMVSNCLGLLRAGCESFPDEVTVG